MNKKYVISVSAAILLPLILTGYNVMVDHETLTFALFGKWFIFMAAGIRLFAAGVKQATDPAFTAKSIFKMQSTEAYPVVRELGFANIAFGLTAIISLFLPEWRLAAAFACGMYLGLCSVMHFAKKPSGVNEMFALITDIIIFAVLITYFIIYI